MSRFRRCVALKKDGTRCQSNSQHGHWKCGPHLNTATAPVLEPRRPRHGTWHTQSHVNGRALPVIIDANNNYPPMYYMAGRSRTR